MWLPTAARAVVAAGAISEIGTSPRIGTRWDPLPFLAMKVTEYHRRLWFLKYSPLMA
jgi:hypothetical protein